MAKDGMLLAISNRAWHILLAELPEATGPCLWFPRCCRRWLVFAACAPCWWVRVGWAVGAHDENPVCPQNYAFRRAD